MSILMASIMNTGFPFSFSFGKSETKELYEKHFQAFKNETKIDLCIYKFESDQGISVQSIFKEKHIEYFICLRHLLASIKYNQFSYAFGNIVKSSSPDDLENSIIFYSSIFAEVTEPAQIILRDKALKKVGLKFEDKLIQRDDERLWKSVSMINRIQSKMPSTTNSLESFHGQINQQTPRRNNFWKAFYKMLCISIEKL